MGTWNFAEEVVDLGAISTETCGLEPIGSPETETGDHYAFGGGAIADDD